MAPLFCPLKLLEKSCSLSCNPTVVQSEKKGNALFHKYHWLIHPIISHNVSLIYSQHNAWWQTVNPVDSALPMHSFHSICYQFRCFYNYQLRRANLSIVPVSSIDSSFIYVIMVLQASSGGADSSKSVAIAIDITLSYIISLHAAVICLQGRTVIMLPICMSCILTKTLWSDNDKESVCLCLLLSHADMMQMDKDQISQRLEGHKH